MTDLGARADRPRQNQRPRHLRWLGAEPDGHCGGDRRHVPGARAGCGFAIEAMKFIAPIYLRDLISVYAEVERVGADVDGRQCSLRPRCCETEGHRRVVHLRGAGRGQSPAVPSIRPRPHCRPGFGRRARRGRGAEVSSCAGSSAPIAGGSTSSGRLSPLRPRAGIRPALHRLRRG